MSCIYAALFPCPGGIVALLLVYSCIPWYNVEHVQPGESGLRELGTTLALFPYQGQQVHPTDYLVVK